MLVQVRLYWVRFTLVGFVQIVYVEYVICFKLRRCCSDCWKKQPSKLCVFSFHVMDFLFI